VRIPYFAGTSGVEVHLTREGSFEKERIVRNLGSAMIFVLVALTLSTAAGAQSQAKFQRRIDAAFRAEGREAALRSLFYLEGVDAETLAIYEERTIPRMLGSLDEPVLGFEPLPDDFRSEYVSNGYEYRPNLELVGIVVLDGNTRAPYGSHAGRFYFTGMHRTLVDPDAPPDRTLQMIVIGMATPPMTFEGYCDLLQSNGKVHRMDLADHGHGNNSAMMNGQRIESCEVTRTSADGAMSLRLLEGDSEIFQERIEPPERTIRFSR
jgi:hypothetical protein